VNGKKTALVAGLRPDPLGSCSAPPDPIAVIGRGEGGKGKKRVGNKEGGRGGLVWFE